MTPRITLVHVLAAMQSRWENAADGPVSAEESARRLWLPGRLLVAALRTSCAHGDAAAVLFGGGDAGGALSLTDHEAMLLPTRSWRGVFAWATAPLTLHCFLRDADAAGLDVPHYVPDPGTESSCLMGYEALKTLAVTGKVVLEELDLHSRGDAGVVAWGEWLGRHLYPDGDPDSGFWRTALLERLCVVHDDVFPFLADRAAATAGQASASGSLREDTGTHAVALPAETVLWGGAVARDASVADTAIAADDVLRMLHDLTKCPVPVWPESSGTVGVCRLRVLGDT